MVVEMLASLQERARDALAWLRATRVLHQAIPVALLLAYGFLRTEPRPRLLDLLEPFGRG